MAGMGEGNRFQLRTDVACCGARGPRILNVDGTREVRQVWLENAGGALTRNLVEIGTKL